MDRTPAARVHGISKRFGDVVALDDVSLEIGRGTIHGLAGPNGAGKTTLLGLLLGLSAPDSGVLATAGEVAGFLDGPSLYPMLTARQNLGAVCALRRLPEATVGGALDQVGLADVADDRVRGFSLGMRQRLGLAAALLCRPRLLVLDEPTNGLDTAATQHIHQVLTRLITDGTAVVLSSHRMDHLALLCSDVTILRTGHVAYTGSMAALAAGQAERDYLLRTTDDARARYLAGALGLVVLEEGAADAVSIRLAEDELDVLVARLVSAGVGVRELTPRLSPVEAAYVGLVERVA